MYLRGVVGGLYILMCSRYGNRNRTHCSAEFYSVRAVWRVYSVRRTAYFNEWRVGRCVCVAEYVGVCINLASL